MTGSIQIKKGFYYVVLNFKDENGKRKPRWFRTGLKAKGNKRKAESMMQDLLREHEGNEILFGTADMLFSEYLEKWLIQKKQSIELSTWEGYFCYSKHIIAYFKEKKLKLRDLKPIHFVEYYDNKLSKGRTDGKGGLSAKSVRSHSQLIKSSLNMAVITGIINVNPAQEVPVPNKKTQKRQYLFLDLQEANELLQKLKGHKLQDLVYITLYYGLRKSEVLGLKWNAVDFDKNTLIVQHTIVKNLTYRSKGQNKNRFQP